MPHNLMHICEKCVLEFAPVQDHLRTYKKMNDGKEGT
ncbi:MAG: hypothetical protein BWY66_01440 [bacterium ADurb.Bin374]|nr:MAG: hypothetical protein BWY66_01440 [bacterium ADurb.Bin374]